MNLEAQWMQADLNMVALQKGDFAFHYMIYPGKVIARYAPTYEPTMLEETIKSLLEK